MVRAIGNDSDSTVEPEYGFTPSRATKMLPLVAQIAAQAAELNGSILAQRLQLKGIDGLPETIDHSTYQEEVRDIRMSLVDDEKQLAECLAELTALGVKPHHPIDGGVDFPATINRRPVHLCWKLGDEAVHHYHEIDDGPQTRRVIDAQAFGDQLN